MAVKAKQCTPSQTAETDLSIVEASVDSGINALRVDLVDEDSSFWPLQPGWEEMFFFCDEKVALVPYERGVREQEAKRTLPELRITYPGVNCVPLRAPETSPAGKVISPELRDGHEARHWLKKHSTRCPDRMHVHAFCHKDLP